MKRPRKIEIKYKHVGDESPEKKKEAEKTVNEFFDGMFDKMLEDKQKREKNKTK